MDRRPLAAVLALSLAAVAVPVPARAADPVQRPMRSSPLTFPINAVSDTAGTFTGTLKIIGFTAQGHSLVAAGIVTGTLVDASGAVSSVAQTVTLPLDIDTLRATAAAAPACDILHLNLGPLHLDLLGLVVDLNRVVLDITAVPGAGNLLGNLLCAITNLLNGPGGNEPLIANLLNNVLSLLG